MTKAINSKNDRNKEIFIEYYTTGKTYRKIAEEYGITYQRVQDICRKYLRLMKDKLKHNQICDFQLVAKKEVKENE